MYVLSGRFRAASAKETSSRERTTSFACGTCVVYSISHNIEASQLPVPVAVSLANTRLVVFVSQERENKKKKDNKVRKFLITS